MKKAKIILGLGFGDEGKGITTDYLCSQNPDALVIRFSGGQQAAHTVMLNGEKHVHSSFCSGALRGLPSYFSEHCTIHPTLLYNEKLELEAKGGNTSLFIHPLTKVTTPFDVWHNRHDSKNLQHGTCGKGVGATMKRNESPYKLYAIDLTAPKSLLIEKLKSIAHYYGISDDQQLQEEVYHFLECIEAINWKIANYSDLTAYPTYIFEGSQGILLDMDHGIFPHVTYAHTTSKNAVEICQKLKVDEIETYYVSRSYATRHGAGWMMDETPLQLINNEEETCFYNEYQKEFRIGKLDFNLLHYALQIDKIYSVSEKSHLVITCLDQLDSNIDFDRLKDLFCNIYGSYSPESKSFREMSQGIYT